MSDSNEDKPVLGRKPLGIKRTVESGQVQQSFSHGRKNTVVVEVKRRRIIGKPGEAPVAAPEPMVAAPAPVAPVAAPVAAPRPAAPPSSPRNDLMSRQEMQAKLLREAEEARMSALEDARRRDEAARLAASEEEKRRAEENRRVDQDAAAEPVVEVVAKPEPELAPADEVAVAPVTEDTADDARPAPRRRTRGPPCGSRSSSARTSWRTTSSGPGTARW